MNLQELNQNELNEINGGVKWYMYLIAPGAAYIMDKFEKGFEEGCECKIYN